ncbi:MAG TPA: NADH-quinone oxidoreductase subunit N [Polyangia bacterium]|jgi:NADH-quinone oxidoreductase subunit N
MNRQDVVATLPLFVSAYAPVLVLMITAFWRHRTGIAVLTLASLLASFLAIIPALHAAPRLVTPLVLIDRFSLFFMGLCFAGGFAVVVLSRDYLRDVPERVGRFYVLLLFAVFGMAAAVSSHHFAAFFLGLETLTMSLYGLIGFTRLRPTALEGGIKYLVLAATSSAFLLFGIALLYAEVGTMEFGRLALVMRTAPAMPGGAVLGFAFILVGFGFKLALVPFHMWSPDVYQGAPAPATALIASGSKGAIFALLFRLVSSLGVGHTTALHILLFTLAVITMFGGNLLALLQKNLKRMLAYSSVAHMGYLLIPLLAGGGGGAAAFGFYLVSYFATIIAAFGVLAVLSARGGEVEDLERLRGLAYRQPFLAAVLALAMLSLTGIPLTAGFVAKFYIFGAAVRAQLWTLVILGILNSGLSAYYYLRVIVVMVAPGEPEAAPLAGPRAWGASGLAVLGAVLVLLGVYPTPLIRLAEAALSRAVMLR